MSLQTRLIDLLTENFTYQGPQDALNIICNSMTEVNIQYGAQNDNTYLFVEDDIDQEKVYTSSRNTLFELVERESELVKEPSKIDSLSCLIESASTSSPPTGEEVQADYSLLDEDRESMGDYIRRESQLVEEKALVDIDVVKDACEHFINPIPTTAPMELTSITNQNQTEINNLMKAAITTYNIQSSHVFYFEVRRAVISLNYHINYSRLSPEKMFIYGIRCQED